MEAMEFGAGIEDAKTPVDLGLSLISLQFQVMDLALEGFLVWETLSEATEGEDAELDLRHIQPAAMVGRKVKLQPLGDAPSAGETGPNDRRTAPQVLRELQR